jgi:peptidoglycan/LPS O-acetylase OafA/YrhL
LHDPSKYLNTIKSLTLLGKAIFFESNLTLFGLDQIYFVEDYNSHISTKILGSAQPAADLVVVPVAWSISIELLFYAIVPFLVKLKSKHISSIIILSLSAKYLFLDLSRFQDPWTYRFAPFELSFFLIGMLISRFRRKYMHLQRESKLLSITWTITAISWYLFSVHYADHLILSRELVILSGCLLILSGVMIVSNSRVLRKLGDLSYPIYLSHLLVSSIIISILERASLSMEANWFLTLMVTFVFSYLLLFITTPVEKVRSKIRLASY